MILGFALDDPLGCMVWNKWPRTLKTRMAVLKRWYGAAALLKRNDKQ